MNIIKKPEPALEVIAHDVAPLTVNTDAGSYARMGWIIVLVGVVGFLIWATVAPLDRGVPLSGTVAMESSRKTVQYLPGGIVQDILVKDGDRVKAGQTLVRMNNVQTKSLLDITRAQYFSARATEARLQAELAGQHAVSLPPTLQKYQNDPSVPAAMALQNQLISSRQSALQSELSAIDESIAGLQMQVQGLQESRDSKKTQEQILKEQLDNMRDLSKDGYVARSRLLDLERTYAQVAGAISEDIGNIGHAQRQVMEFKLHKIQRTSEYQREVRTQLAEAQKEAEGLESRIESQAYDLGNTDVKAPADGIVVGSSIFTRGGVVTPGAKMMEVVPTEDALVVEGQLAVNLIDKVRVGLPVEMNFSAFNTNRTPHIPGQVIQVAADRTVDEHTGQPYYKVRARVTPEGAKLIAQKKLDIVSGMPVEVFVKTGERTMMSYLLKPIFDRSKSALSED